jgi:RHS repeat-associated protein
MTTSYTYDSAGRIHTVTTPDGVVATRSYDDGGRLTEINYPGTTDDVSYTYFADGTRHTMTDGTGTTTYAYDANDSLTSVQNGGGQIIGYGYDDASQLTSITYPGSKTVSYGYDNAGNMTSVTDWASRTTNLTVNADGLQQTRTDPSGVTETRTYDANDHLTDINTATTSATLADYGYGYDNAGQLTSSTTTDALHPSTATDSWGYTPLGQLSSTGASTGYTTTPAGELAATPGGDAFTYNSAQELVSASNTGYGTSTAYAYDGNGSRTSGTTTFSSAPTESTQYGYDSRGNLSSVTTDTTEVDYTSDGDGLRQTRTVGGVTQQFLWDPNHTTPLLLDDGTHSYLYSSGTTPIAQIDDATGAIQYLYSDDVGSVRMITDDSGNTIGTRDFDPYGVITAYAGTSSSNFGYASAWTDPITGTNYLRAREYDPVTGQFLQVDPAVNSTRQPYAYVAGDPLSAADPTGLFAGICDTGGDSCWNYFWGGLLDHIGAEAKVAQAGFVNGALGGIPDQLGLTCSKLKSDNLYWAEYAIGGFVMAAATFGTGEEITQSFKAASGLVEAFILAAPRVSRTAAIVRDAAAGSGNFGLGSGTMAQAAKAGQEWVGTGYRTASDGTTLVSEDGLRQWRPPSYKPKLDKWQSNFQQRTVPRGPWDDNGHLDITDVP